MSSNNPCPLGSPARQVLLDLARNSIRHGLAHHEPLPVDLANLQPQLSQPRATFVTLQQQGSLRGCIGSLNAVRALAEDVALNAYAAAFHDPRFPPLQAHELTDLEIHLALLTPPEPVAFSSEPDLLARLQPGVDGLILTERGRHATFLPAVWQALPNPAEFLAQLKRKAGLPPGYWSDSIRIQRYQTEVLE